MTTYFHEKYEYGIPSVPWEVSSWEQTKIMKRYIQVCNLSLLTKLVIFKRTEQVEKDRFLHHNHNFKTKKKPILLGRHEMPFYKMISLTMNTS